MAHNDREKQILTLLQETPTIGIKVLTQKLYASEATIRRDLRKMEQNGLIMKL